MNSAHQKVTPDHLKRDAYLYVRQSTMHQVLENTESTKRQYALRDRAAALGWPIERVTVIDSDLGQSGASATDRVGFQRLVTAVGMGQVGIVLGLEVSRLARNNTDWHHLLEICGLTDTLILDEDGIYDPSQFNDRMLLGLKGTMSEAELHVLKARLRGGILSKAQRGELKQPLPVGFVYTTDNRVVLNPDQQVQQAIHLLFHTFRRTGSAFATVKAFREQRIEFPRRVQTGPRNGEIVWGPLLHCRVLQVLKNPRYAGAFFFGRTRTRKTIQGTSVRTLSPDEWHTLIRNAHAAYISWEEHEENLRRLRENAQAHGKDRRKSPPREGPALLQGLVLCGVCGTRMTVRYHTRQGQQHPDYSCARDAIQHGDRACQVVPGENLDKAVGNLLIEAVTPLALEVALTVQQELASRAAEADQLRRKKVERARYEADLAQRRYMRVDPENRLVADALEADWNQTLRALVDAQEEYERQRNSSKATLDDKQREEIFALATDFPRLWRDPRTPDRERKRMVRLMVEDVTLTKREETTAHIRFRGGATRTLLVPLPLSAPELRRTKATVVQEIDRLLDHHTELEIAAILNRRGLVSGTGKSFTARDIGWIRRTYMLANRFERLRRRGLLTVAEMAARCGVVKSTVHLWKRQGLLRAWPYNERGDCLFEPPGDDAPQKFAHKLPRGSRERNTHSQVGRGAV